MTWIDIFFFTGQNPSLHYREAFSFSILLIIFCISLFLPWGITNGYETQRRKPPSFLCDEMLAEGAGMDQRCPDKSCYRPLALFDFDSWEHQISEGQYFRGVEQVSCLITQLSYKYFQTFFILVTTKTPVVQLCMDP